MGLFGELAGKGLWICLHPLLELKGRMETAKTMELMRALKWREGGLKDEGAVLDLLQ